MCEFCEARKDRNTVNLYAKYYVNISKGGHVFCYTNEEAAKLAVETYDEGYFVVVGRPCFEPYEIDKT